MTAQVTTSTDPEATGEDPRRWLALAVVVPSILIVVLDNSVLNVSIPTILREFHTTLPALQWVVTGYALTFATFLIIGGRLGDIFGHRRTFTIGAGLFGIGSLISAVSTSVGMLVFGEALIEGIGASLMLPATLAIISTKFRGKERAAAFAVWGATAGAAASFGPVVGGFLTTNYSWRWCFGINVVVAPISLLGALFVMGSTERAKERVRIDVPGAGLIAAGMFLLVFALSEGGTYGWARPLRAFTVDGVRLWPASWAVSVIPFAFAVSLVILAGFYAYERATERRNGQPLFEFGQLRHKGFRYGLLTSLVLSMGQLGLLFLLPVFLQNARHLTAEQNGLWILPTGIFVVLGAQIGGRLTRRIGTTPVVRLGLAAETIGLFLVAVVIRPDVTFLNLLPGLVFYGGGIGFASSQLTNVVLSDIDASKSGVASGANTTVRQVGSALGVAVIGALLTAQTIRHAAAKVASVGTLPAALRDHALASIHSLGPNFAPPPGTSPTDADTLRRALADGVAAGTRPAIYFAVAVVAAGTALSFLIPRIGPPVGAEEDAIGRIPAVTELEIPEPIEV